MSTTKQPTLETIAHDLGLSKSTVSRALRGCSGIRASTTQRVIKVARRLGYQTNPLISQVMRRVRDSAAPKSVGTLAYLTFDSTHDGWRRHLSFQRFFNGAHAHAEACGFDLQEVWAGRRDLSGHRLTRILRARGINGVLVGPTTGWPRTPKVDWQQFAAVKVGTPFHDLALPCVGHHHFRGMVLMMEQLKRRGYRRPGLVLRTYQNFKTGSAWMASFQQCQTIAPPHAKVPPLLMEELTFSVFSNWFRSHRPDVIIGQGTHLVDWLRELGHEVPGDVGFADLDRCAPGHAGIDQLSERIGAAAVDQLVNRLLTNERGLPASASHLLIDGQWADGPTVRKG